MASQSHNLRDLGQRTEQWHSSGSIDDEVLWFLNWSSNDWGAWGQVPPQQQLQSWTDGGSWEGQLQAALSAGISVGDTVGVAKVQTSMVVKLAGALLFSFSPRGDIPPRELVLDALAWRMR